MRFYRALALVAFIPLAACVTGGPRTAVVTPPPAFQAPAGSALEAQALDEWWLIFNDPQLNGLIEDAFKLSPDARSAAQRLLEAQATRDSQDAQTWPKGNLAGTASRRSTTDLGGSSNPLFPSGGVTENEALNFNVSWEMDFFGRVAAARRAANADLAAARFNAESAHASLAASVADAYFQARGAAIQLADARETARIQTELQRISARKVERGLSARSDLDRISGDVAQARAQVAGLEAELQASQRLLLILVGRGFEATGNLPIEASIASPPPMPASVPGELLTRRPDLREAEARVQSAAGRQRVAKLALFPTFTLTPGLGLTRSVSPGITFSSTGAITPSTTTSSSGFWTIGAGITQPVLDIPRYLADIRAQDARTEQAVIAYEKAVQTAYGEAENALVRLGADQRKIALLTDGEARSARAYAAAKARYAAGLDDMTTTLSAEQSWRSARTALTSARVQALRRAVQAYKALGGGWPYSASIGAPQGEAAG